MLNNIVLIGRMVAQPQLRYTQTGTAVANFRLAVDRGFKNSQGENETDFIDCVVWRKQAENVSGFCDKGHLVAVQGRLQIRDYEDNDGNKRKAAEVVCNDVRFLEKKGEKQPQTNEKGSSFDDVPF